MQRGKAAALLLTCAPTSTVDGESMPKDHHPRRGFFAAAGAWLLSTLVMLALGAAQVPALIWLASVATPPCGERAADGQAAMAIAGAVLVAVTCLAAAAVLGVYVLRARWAFIVWSLVCLVSVAAPAVFIYALPQLSPGVGGMFCR